MSLAIDLERITAVLLPDGIWYDTPSGVHDDALEFCEFTDGEITHIRQIGGQESGFEWKTQEGDRIAIPLSSIVAVRHTRAE